MATFKIRDKETGEVFTIREKEPQEQPQPQAQQPNILQQLLGATENTIGGIVGGIIEPPTKIIGRAGQAIESMISGQPPQSYSIPMPGYLGGNIPIEPAQSVPQALGSVAQTSALMLGGFPTLAGTIYGAGMGMEEQESGVGIAGKAVLGGILGKTVATMMGQPLIPKFAKYDNALKRSTTAKAGLDKLRTITGKAKEIAIQEVKDVPVKLKTLGDIPKVATDAIMKPEYNIEILPDGSLKPTIGNLDKVQNALGELIGDKPIAWQEASKTVKRQIIGTYHMVRRTMIDAANGVGKNIEPPLTAYHKFMINYNKINPSLVDKNNQIVANKLKAAFKWSAEPAYKQAWKEISQANPEVRSVMNSMNKRELLKNLLKVSGTIAAVGLGKTALDWSTK